MVGGPVFGPQPRIKQAFFVAVIIVVAVAVASILFGCSSPRIEYRPIPQMLIPTAPDLPKVKAEEIPRCDAGQNPCMTDETYLKLATRDRLLRQYADELRALLEPNP